MKLWIKLLTICFILISVGGGLYFFVNTNESTESIEKEEEKKIDIEEIKKRYNDFVKPKDSTNIYIKNEEKYEVSSIVKGEIILSLDSNYEIIDEYFKILDSDFYVRYDEVDAANNEESVGFDEYKNYKNYIYYNENVLLGDDAKLYVDNSELNYYIVDGGSYPIIIKDSNRYGIEYNNSLVYVNEDDVKEIISSSNNTDDIADEIAVLNYHYTVSATNENGELSECRQIICGTDEQLDSHMKYLKDNNFYSVSLRDLELFIDGKIQLPNKSVCITFDDGWYMNRAINILEKYQMLGTLFLIGNLATPDNYISNYLEIHSHTWDMHGLKTGDDCSNSNYRGGITCFDDERILDDLKKSRESLNNTTYFCYPFYDYTNKAIELLKESGFTMAFAGQTGKSVKVGQDKFRIPRYVMYNYTKLNDFINYVN